MKIGTCIQWIKITSDYLVLLFIYMSSIVGDERTLFRTKGGLRLIEEHPCFPK